LVRNWCKLGSREELHDTMIGENVVKEKTAWQKFSWKSEVKTIVRGATL